MDCARLYFCYGGADFGKQKGQATMFVAGIDRHSICVAGDTAGVQYRYHPG